MKLKKLMETLILFHGNSCDPGRYQARIRDQTCILQRSIGICFEDLSDGWEVDERRPVGSHESSFTHKNLFLIF